MTDSDAAPVVVTSDVTAWELFWARILAGPPLATPIGVFDLPMADALDGYDYELDLDLFGPVTS